MSHWRYNVSGRGKFPRDMLRRDEARPSASGVDLDRTTEFRTIRMAGHLRPTVARWESFGWKVNDVVDLPEDLLDLPPAAADIPETTAEAW